MGIKHGWIFYSEDPTPRHKIYYAFIQRLGKDFTFFGRHELIIK
jgi:hypothetical protein